MGLYGERDGEFSIAENLYPTLRLDHPRLAQNFGSDGSFPNGRKFFQIHDVVLLAKDVGESTLGQAAMQRHLTALKTAQQPRTATRTLTFMSARRGLAHARTHSATHTLALL